MSTPRTAEYGFWKSPITSDWIVAEAIRLSQVALAGTDVYWLEGRPAEGGRNVIMRRTANGRSADVHAAPFSARSRVHEYGGGSFVAGLDAVYFSNDSDQRLYAVEPGGAPRALTPEAAWRYADVVIDRAGGRLIAVREDHTAAGREAVNTIIAIDLGARGGSQMLVSGADFYSHPRLSPDGSRLAWLEWNHPNMPWDGTELWVAEVHPDGTLGGREKVAGGPAESVCQPEWSPDGVLYFVSDRGGWWNLYRMLGGAPQPLAERQAEFGLPQWQFGQSTYAFESPQRLACTYTQRGLWRLAVLQTESGALESLECPYTDISQVRASPGRVVFRGGSPSEPASIVELDLETQRYCVLRRSFEFDRDLRRYFSAPEAIEFPTERNLSAHAFYYRPHNPDFTAPGAERPPLMVISHGGPTASTSNTLSLSVQYWTSRGFAVLDVNYGGSTGYGRAYRVRLNGQWGVVDVEDCVNGARQLAALDEVDGERLIIRGSSAGGYTTLLALAVSNVFRAGASYYGVSDLEALVRDTHKFESRYLDTMIGPYPERQDLYRQRSPISRLDDLSAPIIFFQGSDDKVVPPNQAECMVEALRKKGVPVGYLLFEGEQHGFRQAASIKRALDAELYFYGVLLLKKGLRF